MLPGNCLLATCPHCGEKKELLQLLSGNTLHSKFWSDFKVVYPMLLSLSAIQRCPACGHYFFLSDAKMEEGDDYSFETGRLSFDEAVEAFNELNGCFGEKYEELVFVVIWAFNDMYRNGETPTEEQVAVFRNMMSNILEQKEDTWISHLFTWLPTVSKIFKRKRFSVNRLLRAELCREIGEFEKCIRILNRCRPFMKHLARLKKEILKKAKERDSKVFVIEQ